MIVKNKLLTITTCLLLFAATPSFLNGQDLDPYIESKVDELSFDSLYSRLESFESMGIKASGSEALDNTRDWIISLYEQWGYTDIVVDSFTYSSDPVQNIIISKTGSLYPDTYLIVDGHYDTYGGPGVNDNGSGTATVLEVARIMKDVETDYSIKFIHFTVEEMGLIGSTYYVDNTVLPQDLDIKLVFNIDQVGGVAGEVNNTITCERDEWAPNGNNAASAAYTDTLATITEMYSDLNTFISYAYGSDYVPFMNEGYVVTGFYEYNESSYTHSIHDSISKMDPAFVFEVAKAALAGSMYFSGAKEVVSGLGQYSSEPLTFDVGPNPFKENLLVKNKNNVQISFDIMDVNGQIVLSKMLAPNSSFQIETKLTTGIYFYRISADNVLLQSGKLISR